jgi:environmental stress-induced protein Ves
MRIVRQPQFKSSPWKNGGGMTHEAVRCPARGDVFRWRVSVAHIDASGPFSDFAGYARTMVLLRGAGVLLKLSDGTRRILRGAGDLAQFDGALGVECELLDGPCVDLNLMTAKSMRAVRARVERVSEPLSYAARTDEWMVVFPVDAAVEIQPDGEDATVLEPWDLAVLGGAGASSARIACCEGGRAGAVFMATLS